MDTNRCTHHASHAVHRGRLCRDADGPAAVHSSHHRRVPISRPAREDDPPCPCGRPALVIFTTDDFRDVVWCGA
jgi:hypothetical protein